MLNLVLYHHCSVVICFKTIVVHGMDVRAGICLGLISMQIEWNKAVRRVLRIPYQTHTNQLPLLLKADTFFVQFRKRIAKFVTSFLVSENSFVSFIGELARYNSYGVLGRNLTRIVFKAWVSFFQS